MRNLIPFALRDFGVDSAVGDYAHFMFHKGNENEYAGAVFRSVHAAFDKVPERAVIHSPVLRRT